MGKEIVRSLGGLWTIGEGTMGTGDIAGVSIMTLGYGPRLKRFVGTFVASTMTHLWPYVGTLDDDGKVLAAFLIGASATGKFTEWEGKAQMFEKMGFSTDPMFRIGVLEVVIAVLFAIPGTGFLGAIRLTGYLGGATVTHLRGGDPFFTPVIIGIVMWVALGLRRPKVFSLALGNSPVQPR